MKMTSLRTIGGILVILAGTAAVSAPGRAEGEKCTNGDVSKRLECLERKIDAFDKKTFFIRSERRGMCMKAQGQNEAIIMLPCTSTDGDWRWYLAPSQ
jgi:hypothetical protein